MIDDALATGRDYTPDRVNSVSSKVIRCVYEGRRAVAVGDEDTRTQITALLDLLDLHLTQGTRYAGIDVAADSVALLLGGRPKDRREALDAIGTLLAVLDQSSAAAPSVKVLEHTEAGGWAEQARSDWDVGDPAHYRSWSGLLAGVSTDVPALVARIAASVDEPSLRAYPMLTRRGYWSVRLEGLEIGKLSSRGGTLGVGTDSATGRRSDPRRAWVESQGGRAEPIIVENTDASIAAGAAAVRAFRDHWLPAKTPINGVFRQDEHALESRILRGRVPLTVRGRALDLIRESDIVNWGSQFPTIWGRDGRARYLDGLMRDGNVPWAMEMKVNGGGGVGRYYRHAIAQAVLYREFIRKAEPLHFWFDKQGLDATACQAAVVIPAFPPVSERWRPRLQALCDLFDVDLIEVDRHHAELN